MNQQFFTAVFAALINYFEAAHIVAMLPICEILVFFMLFPHMQNTAESGKALRGGFVIGAISLLLIVMRDTAVLGPLTTVLTLPAVSVTRLINIGHFLTRMDVLFCRYIGNAPVF
jgi:spore germination protein KB